MSRRSPKALKRYEKKFGKRHWQESSPKLENSLLRILSTHIIIDDYFII